MFFCVLFRHIMRQAVIDYNTGWFYLVSVIQLSSGHYFFNSIHFKNQLQVITNENKTSVHRIRGEAFSFHFKLKNLHYIRGRDPLICMVPSHFLLSNCLSLSPHFKQQHLIQLFRFVCVWGGVGGRLVTIEIFWM